MLEDDPHYFQRRAAQEKAAAERATHAAAIQAHERLAQQYSAMADQGNAQTEMH
jgi:hypothetical protein